jgi:rhamnose transport system ATP-binding protein
VGNVILELKGISKYFAGVKAVDDVNLTIRKGEVHALIGENGAGKSTLVKILTGIHRPTNGSILLNGEPVVFKDPHASQMMGITAIHQEVSTFPELTVTENIFMGHHKRRRNFLIDNASMKSKVKQIIDELGIEIDIDAKVKNLSTAERHLVEIVKALSIEAEVVIMDEPTSALSIQEVEELFGVIHKLKAAGKAILFISHRFDELKRIADYYTVLRDGQYVGEGGMEGADVDAIIQMMVGRKMGNLFPKSDAVIGRPILKVAGLSRVGVFDDVSFDLHEGEIIGFYGLVGAGRSEVARALMGIDKKSAGEIFLDGKRVEIRGAKDAIRQRIGFIPEDRHDEGAVVNLPIRVNATMVVLKSLCDGLLISKEKEDALTQSYCGKMAVKATNWEQEVRALSGGNQQKVVIAKWIAMDPRILIMDEPTKGIDVGTKAAVHGFMNEMAKRGTAIIMISSEIPEILGMSDSVIVMHEGTIVGRYPRCAASSEILVKAATGNQK